MRSGKKERQSDTIMVKIYSIQRENHRKKQGAEYYTPEIIM